MWEVSSVENSNSYRCHFDFSLLNVFAVILSSTPQYLFIIDLTVSLLDYNRNRTPFCKHFLHWVKGTQEPAGKKI